MAVGFHHFVIGKAIVSICESFIMQEEKKIHEKEIYYEDSETRSLPAFVPGNAHALCLRRSRQQQHAENAKTNAAFYEYTKNNSGKWNTMNPVTMLYGLQDEEWDIIFLQQSAAHSPQPQTYGDYIDQIMPYVKENIKNPNAKFVWNMTWAYQQDNNDQYVFHKFDNDQTKMYEGIVNTLKDLIVPRTDFHAIIPSGTAIQNARTSYFGDTLTRDGLHLTSLGRLISAYTLFATITKQELTEIKLNEVTKVMSPETQPIVLTDADKQVVIEAVNAAIANPYSVTQSQYTN